jgi:type I restriction enzyme M protein
MDQATHNKIVSFIWGIADDVLRDLFKRGKYPDVILPMCVLRRLDAVLEPTKQDVLEAKKLMDDAGVTEQHGALCQAAGHGFYNESPFKLQDLKARASQQQLRQDFEAYLDGFSPNVQDILDNFKFRNQITTLSKADALGALINKFLDPEINLSPHPVLNGDGSVKHPAMDNHAMGTVFEELVRKFNEDNNEEAGEHWTPRDAVRLMANLVFLPIADQIQSGSYLLYDGAAGTGGMLTVAEETLRALAQERGKEVKTYLYGQEINPETYAICKADMLIKGENADHIVGGAEWSTLSRDAFQTLEFDFMLSNPPYGKNWKKDLEAMGGKEGMTDRRFRITHFDEFDYSLVTRSSDGQMLFLANMALKMNHPSPLGSRIAEVHNGSSLFTGDAGQGESNIRRWIIENDWLEAIVALPLNLFYNTGIATYIWVLSNRKPAHRRGKVQLIDATQWFKPLRKNLGKKNCELSEDDIRRICGAYLAFAETEQSKIFPNKAFGYWKITVEWGNGNNGDEEEDDEEGAPARKSLPEKKKKKLLDARTWERDARLVETATELRQAAGGELFTDHNIFRDVVDAVIKESGRKVSATDLKLILRAASCREESAPPVIAKIHKPGKVAPNALYGRYETKVDGRPCVVEYEPDGDLRDTEQIPLLEEGGIEKFFRREVLPYTSDAWIKEDATRIGYEISFTRHFYKPQPLRTLEEIRADILAVEKEAEGLLDELLKGEESNEHNTRAN